MLLSYPLPTQGQNLVHSVCMKAQKESIMKQFLIIHFTWETYKSRLLREVQKYQTFLFCKHSAFLLPTSSLLFPLLVSPHAALCCMQAGMETQRYYLCPCSLSRVVIIKSHKFGSLKNSLFLLQLWRP